MAKPKITISNPKALSKSDFESLRGTTLFVRMFRNRCAVKVSGLNDAKTEARKEIEGWLRDNCNSLYYVPTGELCWVYIEKDTDAVNFKMFFHDMDVDVPKPPVPPKPPATASKPNSSPPTNATDLMKWIKALNESKESWGGCADGYNDGDLDDLFSSCGKFGPV